MRGQWPVGLPCSLPNREVWLFHSARRSVIGWPVAWLDMRCFRDELICREQGVDGGVIIAQLATP